MNNNLETLIRAIVPLSFMAIWALTSLFNRESKSKPSPLSAPRPDRGPAAPRPRPAGPDPTLRFSNRPATDPGAASPAARRSPDRRDDEIIILSSSTMTRDRNRPGRPAVGAARRPARGKPALPERQPEPPPPTRARLAGVTQNVNQQLANGTMDLTPLSALPPTASLPSLGVLPLLGPGATASSSLTVARDSAVASLRDPVRIREAFILNEILQRPVSLRNPARKLS